MTTLAARVADVYNDFNVAGVPGSGAKKPSKASIRTLELGIISAIDTIVVAAALASGAVLFFGTKALMDGDLAHVANTLAIVKDDATDANNGIYVKVGASGVGSWSNTNLVTMGSIRTQLDAVVAGYAAVNAQVAAAAASATAAAASQSSASTSATSASTSAATALTEANLAQIARTAAEAAVLAAGNVYAFYDTYALASAALAGIPANATIQIYADETRTGTPRALYQKLAGVLTFKYEFPDAVAKQALGVAVPAYGATASTLRTLMTTSAIVRVDGTIAATETDSVLRSYYDSIIRGSGKATGIYGKRAIPDLAPPDVMFARPDLSPRHLPALNAAASPVVVHAGDSISTYFANNNMVAQDMLSTQLEAYIRAQTSKSVTFYNRAISGEGFAGLDGVASPSVFPAWYTTTTNSWLSYIQALTPDCVIISLGMNVAGDVLTRVKSIVAKIQAWTKVPDIVFCTNLVPSPSTASGAPSSWNTIADQEARIAQASAVRHYAVANNFGLLDFNRQQMISQWGYDPRTGVVLADGTAPTVDASGNVTLGSGNYYTNFVWQLTVDPTVWGTSGVLYELSVKIGSGGNDLLILYRASDGTVSADLYYGDSSDGITNLQTKTGMAFQTDGSGHYVIQIEVFDGWVLIRDAVDPTGQFAGYQPHLWMKRSYRRAGRFVPTINTVGAHRMLLSTVFMKGEAYPILPSIKCTTLWADGTVGTGPYGGSGYNHPASYVAPAIYRRVLGQAEWFGSDVSTSGTWTPVLTFSTPGSGPTYSVSSAGWTKIGKQVTLNCVLNITALNSASGYFQIDGSPYDVSGAHVVGTGSFEFQLLQVKTVTSSGHTRILALVNNNGTILTGQLYYFQVIFTTA